MAAGTSENRRGVSHRKTLGPWFERPVGQGERKRHERKNVFRKERQRFKSRKRRQHPRLGLGEDREKPGNRKGSLLTPLLREDPCFGKEESGKRMRQIWEAKGWAIPPNS